jgi:hypothetical protein
MSRFEGVPYRVVPFWEGKMMARRSRMLPIALVLAGGAFAAPAFGQGYSATPTPPVPPEVNGSPASATYSDATVTKAGHALHDVLGINQTYRAKLMATTDPTTRSQLIAQARQEASAAVVHDGLSVDQYGQILASARQDPTLRARLMTAAGLPANSQ